jgi:hypothetical protein
MDPQRTSFSNPAYSKLRIAIRICLLGVFAFSMPPILLTVSSYIFFHTNDRILPGVYVGDLDLSWRPIAEAEQIIDMTWNQQDEIQVIDLQDPDRSWIDNASTFGLSVDAASIAQVAYQQGRGGRGIGSVQDLMNTLRIGSRVDYLVSLDVVQAKYALEMWAERVYIPSEDDQISLHGRDIHTVEAKDGKRVDVLSSLDLMIKDPVSIRIDHQMIPLVMDSIAAQRREMDHALDNLTNIVSREISLRAYDPVSDEKLHWAPNDEEFEQWIRIADSSDAFSIDLHKEKIRTYVANLSTSLGPERFLDIEQATQLLMDQMIGIGSEYDPVFIEYLPSLYVVQPGDNLVSISFQIGMPYWKLYEVNPDLAQTGLIIGEALVVPPRDDMLDLPIIRDKRIVISILEQRMWVYEHDELLYEHVISTGIPSSPTLPGIFQVNSHFENAYASIWDLYMPHFMGIYDAVPGLTNGIHGLPLLASGRRLWADVLGNPASYGCIILDLEAAEQLYFWAEEGVVVEIRE